MKLSTNLPFVIASEAVPGYGEDSYFVRTMPSGIVAMGVTDGCSGGEEHRYSTVNNRTGAWIGSQITAFAADSFIAQGKFVFTKHSAAKMESCIAAKMNAVADRLHSDEDDPAPLKSLPSSLCVIAAQQDDGDELLCEFLWAGDSRGYILDNGGICQMTVDDIAHCDDDAFMSMREDSVLTNAVHGGQPFRLHSGVIRLGTPAMLISATDGCFSYFATPMEFEHAILSTLISAETPEQWTSQLSGRLKEVTDDDITLTIAPLGFEDFEDMKSYFAKRLEQLEAIYISKEENASEKELKALWNGYKPSYYRYKLAMDF